MTRARCPLRPLVGATMYEWQFGSLVVTILRPRFWVRGNMGRLGPLRIYRVRDNG